MKSLKHSLLRLAIISPMFLLLAIIGVFAAHIAEVPQSRVTAVVLVPTLIFIVLFRLAVRYVPYGPPTPEEQARAADMPVIAKIAVWNAFVGVFAGVVTLLTAAAYLALSLRESAANAYHIAGYIFLVSFIHFVALFVFALGYASSRMKNLPIRSEAHVRVAAVWRFARVPSGFAIFLIGVCHNHGWK